MKVLKFRPRNKQKKHKKQENQEKQKEVYYGHKEEHKKPPRPQAPAGITHYCFEIVGSALKQDNGGEVAKNLLTWFIVNTDQETLAKFIKWVVKDNSKENK